MTPHAGADLVAELLVDPQPGTILAPGAKRLIDRLPMRQIMRHQAPGTAGAQPRLEAIEHLPHRVLVGSTASLFRWQEGCQDLPRLISQVRGVGQAPG
jgi:hypothetical protein